MATSQVRTQIYLPRKLHRELRRVAKARGVSMAQLLRETAERAIEAAAAAVDPFDGLVGAVQDAAGDVAEKHDAYLCGQQRRRA